MFLESPGWRLSPRRTRHVENDCFYGRCLACSVVRYAHQYGCVLSVDSNDDTQSLDSILDPKVVEWSIQTDRRSQKETVVYWPKGRRRNDRFRADLSTLTRCSEIFSSAFSLIITWWRWISRRGGAGLGWIRNLRHIKWRFLNEKLPEEISYLRFFRLFTGTPAPAHSPQPGSDKSIALGRSRSIKSA